MATRSHTHFSTPTSPNPDFADAERETPELIVRVIVNESAPTTSPPVADSTEWFGRANLLSASHVGWPVIDKAIATSERVAASAQLFPKPAERNSSGGAIALFALLSIWQHLPL